VIAQWYTIGRMEVVRTVACKLDPTPEQRAEIDATLGAFADACNFIAEAARALHTSDKVQLQRAIYREVRERFGLSANLTIRAIARVCAAVKAPAKAHATFAPTSIDYDARIFSFRECDWTVSLTLLHTRQRIDTQLGEYQKGRLTGRTPTSATLVKRRDGSFFLHIQLVDEAPEPIRAQDVIGVDLGVVNLATDSTGETFRGDDVERVRQRYHRRRRALNRVGTKNARRRLRKIRQRESKFRADENHRIANRIVGKAKGTSCAIGLEDLSGIARRTTAAKPQRSRLKGWAFLQLRTFIGYKATLAGVPVILVDPKGTSRTCSECGYNHQANRKTRDEFCCRCCGFTADADVNAALNIRAKALRDWACVGTPMAGVVDAGPRNPVEAACKLRGSSPRST